MTVKEALKPRPFCITNGDVKGHIWSPMVLAMGELSLPSGGGVGIVPPRETLGRVAAFVLEEPVRDSVYISKKKIVLFLLIPFLPPK